MLRCAFCEGDSHRSVAVCQHCGQALDSEEQKGYNRAYWAKRKQQEES